MDNITAFLQKYAKQNFNRLACYVCLDSFSLFSIYRDLIGQQKLTYNVELNFKMKFMFIV